MKLLKINLFQLILNNFVSTPQFFLLSLTVSIGIITASKLSQFSRLVGSDAPVRTTPFVLVVRCLKVELLFILELEPLTCLSCEYFKPGLGTKISLLLLISPIFLSSSSLFVYITIA